MYLQFDYSHLFHNFINTKAKIEAIKKKIEKECKKLLKHSSDASIWFNPVGNQSDQQ